MQEKNTPLLELIEALSPLSLLQLLIEIEKEEKITQPNKNPTKRISDHQIITHLAGPDLMASISESKISKLYLASFIARHSCTWIAFNFEKNAQKNQYPTNISYPSYPSYPFHSNSPYSCYAAELERKIEQILSSDSLFSDRLQFSMSAHGLEWEFFDEQSCAFFDPYERQLFEQEQTKKTDLKFAEKSSSAQKWKCQKSPDLYAKYCSKHAASHWLNFQNPFEAHFNTQAQELKVTTHDSLMTQGMRQEITARSDTMMLFYANFNNLLAYSPQELEELVSWFWRRLKSAFVFEDHTAQQAAQVLGYDTFQAAQICGFDELKKRYKKKALENHPDLGGSTQTFQCIQAAYGILASLLDSRV